MTIVINSRWQAVPCASEAPGNSHFADYPLYCPSCEIPILGQSMADAVIRMLVDHQGIPAFREVQVL